RLAGERIVSELLYPSATEASGPRCLGANANGHRHRPGTLAQAGYPAHIHVASLQVTPQALTTPIEERHARGNSPVAFATSVDVPAVIRPVVHRLHHVGVTSVASAIGTEQLCATSKLNAALSPEHL